MELEKRHAEEIRKYQFKENQLKENLKKATSEMVCQLTFYSKQNQLMKEPYHLHNSNVVRLNTVKHAYNEV